MPKSAVYLRFYDDEDGPVNISGRVESFSSPQFVKDPEATISIICFDPDFISPNTTLVSGETASDLSEQLVLYDGTIETGFALSLNIDRAVSSLSIYNRADDNTTHTLDFTADLQSGDLLTISTISGQKGASLTRSSTQSSLLYGISPFSDWVHIYPGDNNFRVYAEGDAIPYILEYTTRYGGL